MTTVTQRLKPWIFSARILPGFFRIPSRNNQQSYQDLARSWKITQEAKMQNIETSYSGSHHWRRVSKFHALPLYYIFFENSDSKLITFQRGSCCCQSSYSTVVASTMVSVVRIVSWACKRIITSKTGEFAVSSGVQFASFG